MALLATRGLGRKGITAALLVTVGLGVSAPSGGRELYDGNATGVLQIVRVDVETGRIVGIIRVGKTIPAERKFDCLVIAPLGMVMGMQGFGFASMESDPVTDESDPSL